MKDETGETAVFSPCFILHPFPKSCPGDGRPGRVSRWSVVRVPAKRVDPGTREAGGSVMRLRGDRLPPLPPQNWGAAERGGGGRPYCACWRSRDRLPGSLLAPVC